jgi:hypothetical protein
LLLVDVSISVDDQEYNLQRMGIANAFFDASVQRSILSQGETCVSYVEWAHEQHPTIGWTLLRTPADINAFAMSLLASKRSHRGITLMDKALAFEDG